MFVEVWIEGYPQRININDIVRVIARSDNMANIELRGRAAILRTESLYKPLAAQIDSAVEAQHAP